MARTKHKKPNPPTALNLLAMAEKYQSRKAMAPMRAERPSQKRKRGSGKDNCALVACHVLDITVVYGHCRLLVQPACGEGSQWVDETRCKPIDEFPSPPEQGSALAKGMARAMGAL